MKAVPVLLVTVVTCFWFAVCPRSLGQNAAAKWGPGCNKGLLEGDFAMQKAPEIACPEDRKSFIDDVIDEVDGGYGGTMVTEKAPHAEMDTPEFVAFYLRAFAEPEEKLHSYDYRFERLLSRISGHIAMIEDARLDWDVWRAWLLFENMAHTSSYFEDEMEFGGKKQKVMNGLDGAREVLWNYLSHNAAAILKDVKRRAWWITQLTRELEAPGGRPMRRWFLLALVSAADPKREELEKVKVPEKSVPGPGGRKIPLRQPHPLDPFLIVADKKAKMPAFEAAVSRIATDQKLGLEVLGVEVAKMPPTTVHTVSLEMTKWPTDRTAVVNQESWSKPPGKDESGGYEWGVRFSRPVGRRANFSSVSFPEDRTDGVYFFVFNQRLYVWPKAKMDTAVIQMLHTARLIDDTARAEYSKRGFETLKPAVTKERGK